MTDAKKIQATDEAWDTGALGTEKMYARTTGPEEAKALDEALDLQAISIRLPKSLISDFKLLAQIHEMGYQPLMREALIRFAEHEMKCMATAYANQLTKERAEASEQVIQERDKQAA